MVHDLLEAYIKKSGFFCIMIVEDREVQQAQLSETLKSGLGLTENQHFFFASTRKEAYRMYDKLREVERTPQIVMVSCACDNIESEHIINVFLQKYPDIYLLLYSVENSVPYQTLPVRSLYHELPDATDIEKSIRYFLQPENFDQNMVGMSKQRFEHDMQTNIERAKMEETDIGAPEIQYGSHGAKDMEGPKVEYGKRSIQSHQLEKDREQGVRGKRHVLMDGSPLPREKPKWAKKSWDVE